MAFIFGKWGLASVDYEYTDMADARLRGVDYGFTSENADIRRKYTTTHSLRAGTEWRLDKLSLRAGYGYTSSPIADNYAVKGWDFSGQHISGGIGFREKSFYIDLAYLYSFSDQYLQPYTLENEIVEGSYEHVTGYNFTATFGVKF
jgi:long-subunit fatty acid transport protein